MNFNILNEKKHIIKAYYVEVSVNYAVFHRLRLIVILCIGKQTFCKIQKQKSHPLSVQGPRRWGVRGVQNPPTFCEERRGNKENFVGSYGSLGKI